ncbi:hypothetical protein [Brevundimonas vesicularis]|uniref:hypothetical protein n=1 Tax=Brevundimonas vesicularis TaxID=41276 RepID=UPI0038D41403
MPDPTEKALRNGFALPAVLAVTGVVTLVFLVAITALASLNAEARSARDRSRFIQRAMSAEARLTYLVATEPMRQNGVLINGPILMDPDAMVPEADGNLSELVRLDGRPYLLDVEGPMLVRLQDQAGMINLAHLRGQTLTKFLEEVGIDAAQQGRIQARLIDYTDTDSLRQPDGAEIDEYGPAGLANRHLRRASEFLSVLGVREMVEPRAWRRVRDELAADKVQNSFNVNTAGPSALKVMLDLNPSQIATLQREREISVLTDTSMVDSLVGSRLPWEDEVFYTAPSSAMMIVLSDTRSAWTYRARLSSTPVSLERPVWIDQTEMTEAPRRVRADTTDAVRLPYTPY